MSQKTALVILAESNEELEVATPVDFLRLCKVEVTVAGLNGEHKVSCARGLMVVPDCSLEVKDRDFDVIIMPGGNAGSDFIAESDMVGKMLKSQNQRGALIAGICGSPKALLKNKIGFGKRITSYPLWKSILSKDFIYCEEGVVQDGNIITARGPAQSLAWSKLIAENLVDSETVKVTTDRMLYDL
jgi:DJ-1 family protein